MFFVIFFFKLFCQIDFLVAEGDSFSTTPSPTLSTDVKVEDLDKRSALLVEKTKKFHTLTVS